MFIIDDRWRQNKRNSMMKHWNNSIKIFYALWAEQLILKVGREIMFMDGCSLFYLIWPMTICDMALGLPINIFSCDSSSDLNDSFTSIIHSWDQVTSTSIQLFTKNFEIQDGLVSLNSYSATFLLSNKRILIAWLKSDILERNLRQKLENVLKTNAIAESGRALHD